MSIKWGSNMAKKKLKFSDEFLKRDKDSISILNAHLEKLSEEAKTEDEQKYVQPLHKQLVILRENLNNPQGLITDSKKFKEIVINLASTLETAQLELKKKTGSESNEVLLKAIAESALAANKILIMNTLRLGKMTPHHQEKNPKLTEAQKKVVRKICDKCYQELDVLAYQWLYKEPAKFRLTNKQFYKESAKIIKKYDNKAKQTPIVWDDLHPAFKGLLGVLAAITFIPAILVETLTKKGYVQTFFPSADKKAKPEKQAEHTSQNLLK